MGFVAVAEVELEVVLELEKVIVIVVAGLHNKDTGVVVVAAAGHNKDTVVAVVDKDTEDSHKDKRDMAEAVGSTSSDSELAFGNQ